MEPIFCEPIINIKDEGLCIAKQYFIISKNIFPILELKTEYACLKDEENNYANNRHNYDDDNITGNDDSEDSSDNDDEDYIEKGQNDKKKVKPRKIRKSASLLHFICDICNKKFYKLHRLKGHLRTHQGLKVNSFLIMFYVFILCP